MKRVVWDLGENDPQWKAPMDTEDFAIAMLDCGYELIPEGEADFTVRGSNRLQQGRNIDPHTVIFDRLDTSWVTAEASKWHDDYRVMGYLLPIVAPEDQSMSHMVWGSPYLPITKPVRPLTSMLWQMLVDFPHLKEKRPKIFDVSFTGTIKYRYSQFSQNHREDLLKAWPQVTGLENALFFDGTSGVKVFSMGTCWMIASASKVLVSPWGMCELSWRDYEACLGRCMLVKPRQPEIQVTCSPWHSENTVYCEPDFSDLADAVNIALTRYDEWTLEEIRQNILTAGLDIRILAQETAKTLDQFHETLAAS